jgi:hypothetical protein
MDEFSFVCALNYTQCPSEECYPIKGPRSGVRHGGTCTVLSDNETDIGVVACLCPKSILSADELSSMTPTSEIVPLSLHPTYLIDDIHRKTSDRIRHGDVLCSQLSEYNVAGTCFSGNFPLWERMCSDSKEVVSMPQAKEMIRNRCMKALRYEKDKSESERLQEVANLSD